MPLLRIGGLCLAHGLLLAPMAGVADASFRALCRSMGAEYTVSEMVSAKALCYEQQGRRSAPLRTAPLCDITPEQAPMAVQLFGSEPDFMAKAAQLIETGAYRGNERALAPAAIDINMGCPVSKVVSNGEGSALMKDVARAAAIVRAVKDAVTLPVTVKIRAGWDDAHRNAVEFAKAMEAAGADLITVHGRTRQQFYAPGSDNGVIAAVKAAVGIPVVGNGDLFSADDARRMLSETGCDGLMVARGALGNPFLFREIRAMLAGETVAAPTAAERVEVALSHAADMVARKGPRVGLSEARKHMAWYCKGFRGAAGVRDAVMRATTLEEMCCAMQALREE